MSTDLSYTVLIRLPFPRGDFVDPPLVEWDAAKDKVLWKILSKTPKNTDIDWNDLATKFNVSLPFLLQQAAWLYEHQLLQVREQIMKVGVSIPPSASPGPGSTSELAGGEMMRRTGSGGGREPEPTRLMIARSNHPTDPAGTRALSSLSARRDSPIPKEPVLNATPRPTYSPRSSVTLHPQQPYPNARTPSQTETRQARRDSIQTSPLSSPSSNSGSSSPSPPAPSRLSRRPPKFPSHKDKRNLLDEDDEDDEPAFMPLASTGNDLSAPSQDDPTKAARKPIRGRGEVSQTSDSSTSSVNPTMTRRADGQRRGGPGPLSPKRTAELSGRKDGSDGTPSMGSSFSDLDDASVTQSALEEALASNMRAGGMASRMSTISQALRSRYL